MRCGWVDSGHTPARCPVGGLPEGNGAPAVMVRNLLGLERALLSFAATPQARVRAVQGRPCAGLCARWGGMGRGGGASARLLAPAQVLPPSWRLGGAVSCVQRRHARRSPRARGGTRRGGPLMASQDGDRICWHGVPPHRARLRRVAGMCGVWIVLLCAGWGPQGAARQVGYGPPPVQAQSTDAASELRQRQVAFLHRLRQADPRYQTIEKAVLNADNELGVILNRHVEMDAVRPLMKTLLTQMAKAFPGQHLTVIAYTPSEPPMKIGTARLNARTRQMTYTPAVSQ
jgi:hypothetical protein